MNSGHRLRRAGLPFLAANVVLAVFAGVATAPANAGTAPMGASRPSAAPVRAQATNVCPRVPGRMVCLAERTRVGGPGAGAAVDTAARLRPAALPSSDYGPADLRSAYRVPSSTTSTTVAIIDAFDAPHVAADLAAYRASYGLPACTSATGCFRKVNQAGAAFPLPAADGDWAGETTLDVEMVSAICPSCHILLVEAASDDRYGTLDMEGAVLTATNLGARYVSMSWGGGEWAGERSTDASIFARSGVAYVAASGDYDYGTSWPAANPNVVSVGGTSLTRASNARGWAETVWGYGDGTGTGSGCSAYEPRPSWQAVAPITSLCGHRAMNDVSVVADPNTGVSVYQDGQWWMYGGTSAGAPIIAAMYALAGTPTSTPVPSYPYGHRSAFNDVTQNANGSCRTALCRGAIGWDGPTGVGTPNGVSGLKAPNSIAVHNPGTVTGYAGTAVSVNTLATDSARLTLTYTATGAAAGTAIRTTGYITGTPTRTDSYTVSVTARDATGATGHTSFHWNVVAHRFSMSAAPSITGSAKRGATLTARWGTFRADSTSGALVHPALHVQWYADGTPISGATTSTLKIPTADKGRRMTFRLTAAAGYFTTSTYTSAATAAVI